MKHILFLANTSSIHTIKLASYFRKKFRVTLVTTSSKSIENTNTSTIIIKSRFGKYLSFLKLIRKIKDIVKNTQPDLMISLYASTYGIVSLKSGFNPNIIISIGSDVTKTPFWLMRYVKKSFEYCTTILTLMPIGKKIISNNFGINENKIKCIDWGIDLNVFYPINITKENDKTTLKFLEEFGLILNKKYILSPRSCKLFYNIHEIINGFSSISSIIEHNLIILYALGDEKYWKFLLKIIKDKSLENRIIMIRRFLTMREIALLYSLSSITISIPDRDFRPQSLFEAMGCGSLLIVSDLTVYKDIIFDSKNGVMIRDFSDVTKGIIRFINDDNLVKSAISHNLSYIREFQDSSIQSNKIVRLIESELENSYKNF